MSQSTYYSVDTALSIQALIDEQKNRPGALLPLLHSIQEKIGYIPSDSVTAIAKGLNLSRAEVHGVMTYYHYFRDKPQGKHTIQICRAEACQACGSNELVEIAENTLGCSLHQTTADQTLTLEPVYCLGLCASSPAIQVDDKLYAMVSADQLKKMLTQLKATS